MFFKSYKSTTKISFNWISLPKMTSPKRYEKPIRNGMCYQSFCCFEHFAFVEAISACKNAAPPAMDFSASRQQKAAQGKSGNSTCLT